jgi:hypothetical protein
MKYILTILVFCFAFQVPKKHKHTPVKKVKFYDPLLYRDTTKLKANVITYVVENDSCKVCHQWYKIRQDVDTFSTKRKAKYSNIKYRH